MAGDQRRRRPRLDLNKTIVELRKDFCFSFRRFFHTQLHCNLSEQPLGSHRAVDNNEQGRFIGPSSNSSSILRARRGFTRSQLTDQNCKTFAFFSGIFQANQGFCVLSAIIIKSVIYRNRKWLFFKVIKFEITHIVVLYI